MAQPHDKTGKKCFFYTKCKTEFTDKSMTFTISKPNQTKKSIDEKILICRSCHNEYYAKGE